MSFQEDKDENIFNSTKRTLLHLTRSITYPKGLQLVEKRYNSNLLEEYSVIEYIIVRNMSWHVGYIYLDDISFRLREILDARLY